MVEYNALIHYLSTKMARKEEEKGAKDLLHFFQQGRVSRIEMKDPTSHEFLEDPNGDILFADWIMEHQRH